MKTGRSVAWILVLCCAGCATSRGNRIPAGPHSALDVLQRHDPATRWDGKSLLRADLDLDGGEDYAVTGIRKDRLVVGIVHGPTRADSRIWTLDFPWTGGEDALCSRRARITLERLADNEGPKAGHPRQGMGLNLHDELCDAFHIYWNPDERRFEWWRL